MLNRSKDDLIAAHHEAGHAVGAFLLGVPFAAVALADPGSGKGSVHAPFTIGKIRECAVVAMLGRATERLGLRPGRPPLPPRGRRNHREAVPHVRTRLCRLCSRDELPGVPGLAAKPDGGGHRTPRVPRGGRGARPGADGGREGRGGASRRDHPADDHALWGRVGEMAGGRRGAPVPWFWRPLAHPRRRVSQPREAAEPLSGALGTRFPPVHAPLHTQTSPPGTFPNRGNANQGRLPPRVCPTLELVRQVRQKETLQPPEAVCGGALGLPRVRQRFARRCASTQPGRLARGLARRRPAPDRSGESRPPGESRRRVGRANPTDRPDRHGLPKRDRGDGDTPSASDGGHPGRDRRPSRPGWGRDGGRI